MATLSLSVRAPGERDGDGLPDEYEVLHQLNPDFAGDGNLDADEDGLSNFDELDSGTNPRLPDTDGDFQPDGLEAAIGTDPLVPEQLVEGEPPPLDDSCVVSALNRSARVQPNGVWVLPNVPASAGRVRVRATCVKDGVTRSGQSDFFTIPPNGTIEVAEILFDALEPIPAELILSAPQTVLTEAGQTVQLTATARFPDGTNRDLSTAATGTGYISSNPAIASVTADGLVTARVSGTVVVSALNDGALGVLRLQVLLSGDSDGDGLPDDVELANGLDPNNPVDVLDDPDADGLSTADEFQAGLNPFDPDTDNDGLLDGREGEIGTNPLLFDTDGDGLSDGLEVQLGSDPLDPNSFNLAAALRGMTVTPDAFTLVVNTIAPEASRQVKVMGQLIDGRSLDITARRYGTSYSSSDLTVASFGAEDGRIYAGQEGTATITVANSGFSATTLATVQIFAPTALAWVDIAGRAKDVAVAGDYAYVAAGDAGLQVVDISTLTAPAVVAALDTAGDAQDIKVVGDLAFLADGPNGLVIIDVSLPLAPRLLGQVATPGAAVDIAVDGDKVMVADQQGLRVVDVADPSSPVVVGGVELPGPPNGVDVYGPLAVVACLTAGVRVVDVADPAAPRIVGSTHTRGDHSYAVDVTVREHLAYIADVSIYEVDFRRPSNPVVVQTANVFPFAKELALDGRLALAPDLQTPNAIAILDTSQRLTLLAYLDLRPVSGRGVYRHGLDVRDGVAFVTASSFPDQQSPYSGLQIGRYAVPSTETGLPPTVCITAPAAGSTAEERTQLRIRAEASDDGRIESVQFLLNGMPLQTDFGAPYEVETVVPGGAPKALLRAVATDGEGNRGVSEEIAITVVPNAEPVAILLAPVPGWSVSEGSVITLAADASDDQAVRRVELYVDGALVHTDNAAPYRSDYTVPLGVAQIAVTALAYDDLGASDPISPVVVAVTPDLPPRVAIIDPQDGDPVVAGGLILVTAAASDDVRVAEVRLLADGVPVQTLLEPPYEFDARVLQGASELRLTAVARDSLGQEATAEVVLPVLSDDPGTTIVGSVVDLEGDPVGGAAVACAGETGTSLADGTFSIPGVPAALSSIRCRASFRDAEGRESDGFSQRLSPVQGGITDVGQIRLQPTGAFLYPGPQLTIYAEGIKIADVNEDEIPDLVAADSFNGAAVFLGTPNGGYETVRYFETAGSPNDVLVGDFNGDTAPDIATANGGSNDISILLGHGDGTFQSHVESALGANPAALAAGDFNEDGRLDLVAAGGNLYVLLGNGNGTLVLAGSIAAGGAISVEVGDVNQDGHLDLISAQRSLSNVRIFLGNGTGSFTLSRTVSSSSPDDLTVGDLNGDGRLDFATASAFGNRVRVFFGQADGSYLTGPVLATGSDPLGVIASDMDADGDLDLATANDESSDVSLFLNSGNGSFSGARVAFTGASPSDLAAGDLNRDGIADLVTANRWGLSLVFGLGNATFDTDLRYPAGEDPAGVTVGDFNADGAQDVAVASNDSAQVAVLLGRGDGTFAAEQRFPAGNDPLDVAAADLNGDGKLDLVTANPRGDAVNVLLGQGDGTFELPTPYPVGDFPSALVVADLNGDGRLDLATANSSSDDVTVLLGNGDGTFAPQRRYPVGEYPWALAVSNFQGNGHPGLVTANDGTRDLSLLSSDGAGGFHPEVRLLLGTDPYPFPQSVAVADFDGDGKQDLALSYLLDYDTYQEHHGVFLGNGDGTFQPIQVTPAGPNGFGLMIVADVNGDGIPDLVSTSPGGAATQDILIVLGQGDGTFGEPQRYAVGCAPYYLAAGDFNGDGQVDLATSTFGCYATYDISILIHH